jgi:hypothetical protein
MNKPVVVLARALTAVAVVAAASLTLSGCDLVNGFLHPTPASTVPAPLTIC